MDHIYELGIWNQVKLWSSQLWTQFLCLRAQTGLSEWVSEWVSEWSRAWMTKLMRSLFNFNNWCPFSVILFAAHLLPFPLLIFLMKREIVENLRQDFDSRMINWLANMLGKPVGFERINSLWSQNTHKTSPRSFHVDIPLRCPIFSNFETFCKNLISCHQRQLVLWHLPTRCAYFCHIEISYAKKS